MSDPRQIPDGKPMVYGRDFTLAKGKWTVRKQPNGTWVAQSPAPYRPHPYVYDTWREAYDFASTNGDPLAVAIWRIQRIAKTIDAITGNNPPRPPIKEPSHTTPTWAINVGKAKRDPRSSRRVK